MADHARARRLAKRIMQVVASTLEHDAKDPRLARVTVTDARLTGDLRDATVYYTVMGAALTDSGEPEQVAEALEGASGRLRSIVGEAIGVRFTPTLTFVADTVPEGVQRIDDLLARAREADAEVARMASSALPAGEADPYWPEPDPEASDPAPDERA